MDYHRDKDYLGFERTFRNIFLKRFSILNKYRSKPGRVLDVGCSNGVFLDIFKKRGWETWGVEPSGSAENAKAKKHKIIKAKFEQAEIPADYFDVVILNHTLEHMTNPTQVLQKITKVLRKAGLLYIDVPNAGSLGALVLGKRWPYLLPREHKWQFTKASLTNLLTNSGFKIKHWESRSGILEYANPFLEVYRKRFWLDILTSPYALAASALGQGDSMTFICTKK